MKSLLLFLILLFTSCAGFNGGVLVTTDSICFSGMTGQDATEACYNHKLKTAYIRYVDGHTENLKPIGGGIIGNRLVIMLEGGGRIAITKEGGVEVIPAPVPAK